MDKSAPRFQAGSMSLPDGAGNITEIFSFGDILEIYTATETYRVKSPVAIDPQLTDPNAPWVSSKSAEFGSASNIVARVFLQGADMINDASLSISDDEKNQIFRQLHTCKESLLVCEKVRLRVSQGVNSIVDGISKNGVDLEHGCHIKDLPQVVNLYEDASSFLIHIKKCIVCICYLASYFLPLSKKDNNLESLKKSLKKLNDNRYSNLIDAIDVFIPGTKHLIDLRNYLEHPGDTATHIQNFTITSKGEIGCPVWYVTGGEPESVIVTMESAVDYVISLSESMLMHYLLASIKNKFPLYIRKIPEVNIDPLKPIKFRLSVDTSSFKFNK